MMQPTEITVGGQLYQVGRLSAMQQFHVVRRLAGVITECGPLLQAVAQRVEGGAPGEEAISAIGPVAQAVAKLSDADSEYVIKTCLGAVMRSRGADRGWQPMIAPNGRFVFEDVELPDLMQIVWKVLEVNLLGFTFASRPTSTASAPDRA